LLEVFQKGVELFVNSNRKTSFFINLKTFFGDILSFLSDFAKIDFVPEFLLDFGIPCFVIYCKLVRMYMIILGVVDVEIFLAMLREDRVELEEVLPAWGGRAKLSQR